jgi:phosphotransferase system HPr (HPr) family protein
MAEARAQVLHPTGLHARPAVVFVNEAQKYKSRISVLAGGRVADAKSILSVLSLGATKGTWLTIRAEGPDAAAAVHRLAAIVSTSLEREPGEEDG